MRQIDSSLFSRLDLRVSKAIALGESRKIELIGQVFNVLGATIWEVSVPPITRTCARTRSAESRPRSRDSRANWPSDSCSRIVRPKLVRLLGSGLQFLVDLADEPIGAGHSSGSSEPACRFRIPGSGKL